MGLRKVKRVISIIIVCIMIIQITSYADTVNHSNNVYSSNDEIESFNNTYFNYINGYSNTYPDKTIDMVLENSLLHNVDYNSLDNQNIIEFNKSQGSIENNMTIAEEGLYCLWVSFAGLSNTDSNILFSLEIDGKNPFFEAQSMPLYRQYSQDINENFEKDLRGNDLKPEYNQNTVFEDCAFYQKNEGRTNPYYIFLTKGDHKIKLTSINPGVALSKIWFGPYNSPADYKTYKNNLPNSKTSEERENITLDCEKPSAVSSKTIYPLSDRNDPNTYPFSEKYTKLNYIGGTNWDSAGEWIQWDIKITHTGLYNLSLRVRQNQLRGLKCYRTIRINDEIPFKELCSYGFSYSRDWKVNTLGDENSNTPYMFYLTPGVYKIRIEVCSGDMMEPLVEAENVLEKINKIYREIIMITSTEPDTYRDYNLEKSIPDLVDRLKSTASELQNIMNMLYEISGMDATNANSILTMISQLEDLADKPKTIVKRIGTFYTNMTALSAWVLSARQQPLDIDELEVSNCNTTSLKRAAPWYKSAVSAVVSWFYSFIIDYDMMGDDVKANKSITVWLQTGRDQAESLKQLINSDFSKKHDINVKLRLVQGALLESTVSGNGPDVALNTAMYIPVDYASRGVLLPIDEKEGYDQLVADNFMENAIKPYIFNKHTYALPETQDFQMMFYRKDILEKLNLNPPQTWTDLKEMLNVLALNNNGF